MAVLKNRPGLRMKRSAFTIVELLVVVAIIAILISLLLPAIQVAREAARRKQCANNLRQVSVALLLFHDQAGEFPSGGWGHEWVGMRDRGSGPRQPGGWIYSLLPFIEQASLHRLGATNSTGAAASLLSQPLSVVTCPTRRALKARPVSELYPYMLQLRPAGASELVGRGDYAINGGATKAQSSAGPLSLAAGDASSYSWPNPAGIANQPTTAFTGISHVRMSTSMRRIEDGTSSTYLLGEKYLDPLHYENGESLGDNESLYNGYCSDNHRFTELTLPPTSDGSRPLDDHRAHFRFGSSHPEGLNMAFCDGAVRFVLFNIDPEAHYVGGHVADAKGFAAMP
jgi:prepilin-type N-terminal cleavage/methylation domain-containing protein/prepilin-type processing-associated H-X9-DG protein